MKKILSIFLCVAVLIGFIPSATINAKAAGGLDYIEANQTWRDSWNGDTRYVYLTVEQTGYYDLNITDYVADSGVYFYVKDMDFESNDNYWYNTSCYVDDYIETYDRENLYLIKDHLYQIEIAYGEYDEDFGFIRFYADLSFTFTKTDYSPSKLTLGTNTNMLIGSDAYEWVEIKTSIAGDYLFTLNDYADFNLAIYEKVSGEFVKFTYFDFYKTTCLNLKANTEYIIMTSSGETSDKLFRLKVTKAVNNVTNIDLIQSDKIWAEDIYSYNQTRYLSYPNSSFSYIVTYSDNSKKTLSYEELRENGIVINDIIYLGGFDECYTGEFFMHSGNQSVQINYMDGKTSKSSIYVTSYVDWLIGVEANTITDFDSLRMTYKEDSDSEGYWLIKPDETNNYDIYSSEWHKLDIDFFIFDKNNVLIPYRDGYNLKEGNLYSLKAVCTFNDYYSDGFQFSYEPNRDHTHFFDKTIVTKATFTANGKSYFVCNTCEAVEYSTTIYSPKTFILSATNYTYDGKVKTPAVTVKDAAGKIIPSSNYTVSYAPGRTNVGTYKVTITMKGNYTGTKTLYFKINPAPISQSKVNLSATSYTYNGKVKTPTVTVKNSAGQTLKNGTDYTVTYASGRKKVGKYKVTVTMKGNYSGTKTLYFTINPKATSVKKVTAAKKSLKVSVAKQTTEVTGYEIQYSTSKKFKSAKKVTIKKAKTTSATIKKLKAKKTYYVRVRTYKTVGGKKYYSAWSKAKSKKTK